MYSIHAYHAVRQENMAVKTDHTAKCVRFPSLKANNAENERTDDEKDR